MSKQRIILLVIAIVILVVVGIILGVPEKEAEKTPTEEVEEAESPTRKKVPEDIVVPEIGSEVEEDVAVPEIVTEAARGAEAKFRRFEIKAENNVYTPSTVIVNKGDIVHINFTAVDKKYDLTFPDYGMRQVAEPGETKIIEFQAFTQGKFLFYSALYGGLEGEMKGYIIVK